MVCVLDQKKRPLMPCTPKRARLLLARGRAVVHRVQPFVIRLKDRRGGDCVLPPISLQMDSRNKTTGIAPRPAESTTERGVPPGLLLPQVTQPGRKVLSQ